MSSGWGTQDASGSGWGSAQQQNNGAFDTGTMANALPDTNGHAESRVDSGNSPTNGQAAQAADDGSAAEGNVTGAWAPSQKYDYDQYADSRGGDFDGNKRVYHWDGEEGDIGPEFPELEEELFGPADKRELPTGIDFSRYVAQPLLRPRLLSSRLSTAWLLWTLRWRVLFRSIPLRTSAMLVCTQR